MNSRILSTGLGPAPHLFVTGQMIGFGLQELFLEVMLQDFSVTCGLWGHL
jgi:hypothetical protein